MQPITTAIPYFSESELRCKGSGIIKLDPRFADALPMQLRELRELREAWGKPLSPNSVCRAPSHNKAVGGHPNSLHLTKNPKWPTFGTMACDIKWRRWKLEDQQAFAELALSQGWRVGLHDGFCHIDRLLDIAPGSAKVFLYGTYTGPLYPRLTIPAPMVVQCDSSNLIATAHKFQILGSVCRNIFSDNQTIHFLSSSSFIFLTGLSKEDPFLFSKIHLPICIKTRLTENMAVANHNWKKTEINKRKIKNELQNSI